jgi:hypothetical protein
MKQRSATRQFRDPIFLGAAVIVPPVRPGWADADATVAKQAASLAEKAFDDAGRPDITANDWEQLMAQVVSLATSSRRRARWDQAARCGRGWPAQIVVLIVVVRAGRRRYRRDGGRQRGRLTSVDVADRLNVR